MNKDTYDFEVTLYLVGTDLDPAHVSTVLGIEPSKSQIRGERKITSTKREFTTQTGLWALVVRRESTDLSALLDELVSRLPALRPELTDITGVDDAYVDVFGAVDADSDGGGTCEFELSARCINTLRDLTVPARFTIAVVKA